MLSLKSESKNVVFFIALVLAAFGVYYFYFRTPTNDELLSSNAAEVAAEGGGDLLVALLDLKTLKLDGELLNDPVFQGLKDFHVEIKPEPIGRDNPFAPTTGVFESGPSTIRIRTFETE